MKPIMVENSKIPVILSVFSPITIYAITIWPFVFCRGKIRKSTAIHETIHIEQCNDFLVIGFIFIYLFDYLKGLIKYRKDLSGTKPNGAPYKSVGEKAYFRIRAEQEAFGNHHDEEYLGKRKRREWVKKYSV